MAMRPDWIAAVAVGLAKVCASVFNILDKNRDGKIEIPTF